MVVAMAMANGHCYDVDDVLKCLQIQRASIYWILDSVRSIQHIIIRSDKYK